MSVHQQKHVLRPAGLALVAIAVFGAVAAFAVVDDDQRNFDARVDLNRDLRLEASGEQANAIEALRGAIPSLGVTIDPVTGATRSLNNQTGYLTKSDPGFDPGAIAAAFIGDNFALLGLTAGDVGDFEADTVFSAVTGATRIYLRQTHLGLPVYNGQLQVNVDRDGRILGVNNAFMPDLAGAVNGNRPGISARTAIAAAFDHLGGARGTAGEARLMWLPIRRADARLVWNFQIATSDLQHHYDFTVDANSGEVWTRFDWVSDAAEEYTVYAEPIESPIHTSPLPPADARTVETAPANATASPLGWHDDGGTQYTIARGNNVHAYPDRNGNNIPDFDVDCNDAGSPHCNFPIDLTMNPPAYIDAAVANLFYWNNYIHDTQYLYGFDEASGNFQVDNFGNGGAGGDDVRAEAQDNDIGGSNCNANFFTPSDGSRPRMQMYTCNAATPERDGDFDNLVIVHEYGHGISNRLVGGPGNVGCLGNIQQMGEGWSDLLGLIYTHQTGFLEGDARGVGSYLFNEPAVGGGIRTFPYSTDLGVNPDTYSDIGARSAPHGVGSVWAEIAWEAYWKVVNARGFDPDLQNTGTNAGNQRMMLYITEGMKNTACSPTFLDARDGIIQAATANNGGEDVCLLWEGFALRGLGTDASTPGPNSKSGTDGFQVPPACSGDPCGDGFCAGVGAGEDCSTCPADCPSFPIGGADPNNGVCEAGDGETCYNSNDCNGKTNGKPADRFCCGLDINESTPYAPDGCGTGSTCNSAGNTCTTVPVGGGGSTCCGDGVCESPQEDNANCEIDCPAPVCGNNMTEAPEVCDGTDLGVADCISQGCTGGTLACLTNCSDFDTSACTGCVCIPTHSKEKGPRCSDGLDNDCDGLIDGDDPDC